MAPVKQPAYFSHPRFKSVRPLRKTSPLTKIVRKLLANELVVVIQVGFGYYVFTASEDYDKGAVKDLYDWNVELSVLAVAEDELDAIKLFERVVSERKEQGLDTH